MFVRTRGCNSKRTHTQFPFEIRSVHFCAWLCWVTCATLCNPGILASCVMRKPFTLSTTCTPCTTIIRSDIHFPNELREKVKTKWGRRERRAGGQRTNGKLFAVKRIQRTVGIVCRWNCCRCVCALWLLLLLILLYALICAQSTEPTRKWEIIKITEKSKKKNRMVFLLCCRRCLCCLQKLWEYGWIFYSMLCWETHFSAVNTNPPTSVYLMITMRCQQFNFV